MDDPARLAGDNTKQRPLPTDAEYQAKVWELFDIIEQLQNAVAAGTVWPEIEKGSNLAADDRRTSPLQMSHSIQTLLVVAVDHQHALASLVRGAPVAPGIVHKAAPFTLTRSAVEAAATAHWMLEPTDSWRQRVRRLVIYQQQDRYDYEVVSTLIQARVGGTLPATLEKRKKWIAAIIETNGITDLKGHFEITKVIQQVDAVIDDSRHIETFWRTASAFAHGRQWAIINALMRKEVLHSESSADVVRVNVESDMARVFWGVSTAYELTDRALSLYYEACKSPRR
jgi:hypothetical protein